MSLFPTDSSFTPSLKDAQIAAIYRMLAFNDESSLGTAPFDTASLPPAGSPANQWKILVYDQHCRSIISPILTVPQLRRHGVTLHLLLESPRETIADVPAVYFLQPTRENLARVAKDCHARLYRRIHLNFCTKIDRALMEEFAKLVVGTGGQASLSQIASLHDQFTDFVCFENRLFSLATKESYVLYNSPTASEATLEQAMTDVAYGLFSVVATVGQVPVIRCPKGGAPEMVARKLNRMIAEHPSLLRGKTGGGGAGMSTGGMSGSRPLLVILDRNADLLTPVQHTSTYQALIDDLLTHSGNRVEFDITTDPDAKRPTKTTKRYDLDPDRDPFYREQKFHPFPEAIESNGSELQEVTEREREIRSKATSSGNGSGTVSLDPFASTGANELANAVDSLPALIERKKQLEVHTSILQAVMNQVAARDVPQFYELESSLATGSYRNDPERAKKDVLALITGAEAKGNIYDRIRLVVVFALSTGGKTADLDEVATAVQESAQTLTGPDVAVHLKEGMQALAYLKKLRSLHMIPTATDMLQELQISGSTPNAKNRQETTNAFTSFMAKATTQATGLIAKATDKVVSSMLGKIHKNHATAVCENLCEYKPGTEDDSYLYLDPKVKGDVDVRKLRTMTSRAPVHHVVAFVIGGGSYGEYQNLQSLLGGRSSGAGDPGRRQISYGSTEIMNASSFISQLGKLG